MALTREQRLAIIDFLTPLLNDETKRQTHVDLLFAGVSRRPDLDLRGGPRETTTRIVLKLETYSLELGRPALVDLLDQVAHDVGVDFQARIETWKSALLTPAASPSPAALPEPEPPAQPPVSSSVYTGPKQPFVPQSPAIPPSGSRAEQFSLPAPFEWITIPAGKVTLEGKNESYLKETKTFDVPAFGIGKYPVTEKQYRIFIDAGGYRNKSWWTKKGWRWLSSIPRPTSDAPIFDSLSTPMLVTWYEAVAFLAWLAEMTGDPISLPTEQQWQRAAQGDDGRLYPWGNEWDERCCNNRSGNLSPVNKYEGVGGSPYGVVDMTGNAAEWTSTNWTTGEQGGDGDAQRLVRGGSYQNQHVNFYRVTTRHKESPYAECGFRIVRVLNA